MNKQRRNQLDKLSAKIEATHESAVGGIEGLNAVVSRLIDYRYALDGIKDDEQEAFDNKPETLQDSAQDALDSFMTHVEEADDKLCQLIDMDDEGYDSDEVDTLLTEITDALSEAQE